MHLALRWMPEQKSKTGILRGLHIEFGHKPVTHRKVAGELSRGMD